MTFSSTLSLIRWQSISMCLVLSWNTRFEPICRIAWLSQNNKASLLCSIPISLRKYKYPNYLTIGHSHSSIFYFCRGSRHYAMFFFFPVKLESLQWTHYNLSQISLYQDMKPNLNEQTLWHEFLTLMKTICLFLVHSSSIAKVYTRYLGEAFLA